MNISEGMRRFISGFAGASMILGGLLLIISLAVFIGQQLNWTTISPSIPVVQSGGWMVIVGLILSCVVKAPSPGKGS